MEPFNGSPAARRRAKKGASLNVAGPMPLKKSKAKTSKTNKRLGVPAPITPPKKRNPPY